MNELQEILSNFERFLGENSVKRKNSENSIRMYIRQDNHPFVRNTTEFVIPKGVLLYNPLKKLCRVCYF